MDIVCADYTQERRHSARLFNLVDLHNAGTPAPLKGLLHGLEIQLAEDERVDCRFEWHKVDLALTMRRANERRIVAIEFKVDSTEGGLFEDDISKTQTGKLHAAFEAEQADERQYLYVTLGDGEFAGPPALPCFRWITLDTFASALEKVSTTYAPLQLWLDELRTEQDRRARAPYLAAQGDLWLTSANVQRLGYRAVGVLMSVYYALICEWRSVAAEREFGPLRAYAHGPGPDAILNLWQFLKDNWWYFEINANGMLNLKVKTGEVDESRWNRLTQQLTESGIDSARTAISGRPNQSQSSKAVCSWNIGLWQHADRPAEIVRDMCSILRRYVPLLQSV